MGCASSTEVVIDPVTGQTKVKHTLGGAPPGLRRPQNTYDLSQPVMSAPIVPVIPALPVGSTSTKPTEPDIPVATPTTNGGLFDSLNADIQSKGNN